MSSEYQETTHDFNVRFAECYGYHNGRVIVANDFIEEGGKIKLIYSEVRHNITNFRGLNIVTTEFSGSKKMNIEYDNDVFILPKLGYINCTDYAVYIERNHKRSSPSRYRRGLMMNQLKATNISFQEIAKFPERPINFTRIDHLTALSKFLFNPVYYSIDEALELILSGKKLSVAITNTIAIKLNERNNTITLMKNLWEIGEYNQDKNVFDLKTRIFNESLEGIIPL